MTWNTILNHKLPSSRAANRWRSSDCLKKMLVYVAQISIKSDVCMSDLLICLDEVTRVFDFTNICIYDTLKCIREYEYSKQLVLFSKAKWFFYTVCVKYYSLRNCFNVCSTGFFSVFFVQTNYCLYNALKSQSVQVSIGMVKLNYLFISKIHYNY